MNRKLDQAQARHYKDPDNIRASKSISMTDAEFEQLNQAAKLAGQSKGDFIAKMVDHYLTLAGLRQAERNFDQERA